MAVYPPFASLMEMVALTANFTIALQTTSVFAWRYFFHTTVPMNLAALLASVCGMLYSVFKLWYWFNGVNSALFTCDVVQLGGGILLNVQVALSFLFLFLRADAGE